MSNDDAGRVNGMLYMPCLVQHLVCTFGRGSLNGGSWRWKSRHDRGPETTPEGISEVPAWVRSESTGSCCPGQERARTTPRKGSLCQEPLRSRTQGRALLIS